MGKNPRFWGRGPVFWAQSGLSPHLVSPTSPRVSQPPKIAPKGVSAHEGGTAPFVLGFGEGVGTPSITPKKKNKNKNKWGPGPGEDPPRVWGALRRVPPIFGVPWGGSRRAPRFWGVTPDSQRRFRGVWGQLEDPSPNPCGYWGIPLGTFRTVTGGGSRHFLGGLRSRTPPPKPAGPVGHE